VGRTTVVLDDEDMRGLERLALTEGRPVDDLVREAIHNYVAQRIARNPEWRAQFDALIARIQSHIPTGMTPDEIEADARAALAEVREARRARDR
jgi:hypothetical protein